MFAVIRLYYGVLACPYSTCICYFDLTGAMDSGFTLQGPGTGLTLLAEVRCSGTEDRIFDCSHKGFGFLHTCYSEFATVSCRRMFKLNIMLHVTNFIVIV